MACSERPEDATVSSVGRLPNESALLSYVAYLHMSSFWAARSCSFFGVRSPGGASRDRIEGSGSRVRDVSRFSSQVWRSGKTGVPCSHQIRHTCLLLTCRQRSSLLSLAECEKLFPHDLIATWRQRPTGRTEHVAARTWLACGMSQHLQEQL